MPCTLAHGLEDGRPREGAHGERDEAQINKLIVDMGKCEVSSRQRSKIQRRMQHLLAEVTKYKDEKLREDERDV